MGSWSNLRTVTTVTYLSLLLPAQMTSNAATLSLAIVDDDQAIRSAMRRLLRAFGHEVYLYESAEAYLERRCTADCVILDVHLPGLSGLELEGRLRTEGRRIPVVFITAHDDPLVRDAVGRTCSPLLRKPFEAEGLLAAIAMATERTETEETEETEQMEETEQTEGRV